MEGNINNTETLYSEWSGNGLSIQKIKEDLTKQGLQQEEIENLVSQYNKHLDQKRTVCGFKCMAGGGALCMTSLFLNFLNAFPDMRGLTLYGLTFAGIITGLIGMYLLLEKRQVAS